MEAELNKFDRNTRQHNDNNECSLLAADSAEKEKFHIMFSPVAIIGFAFRFPGDLKDETGFWDALKQKQDLVTSVPEDRWAVNELQHKKRSEPGRSITFSAGVLSRIGEFDAGFFGISPREAAWLDPQQRLLLELTWECMENSGIPSSELSGSDCAVYVGISSVDYGTRWLDDLASMTPHSMTGNTLSIAANRISYVFDLHGPSLAVDTACSSSMIALHHACRALQSGEAGTALVGGVNLLLHPYPFVGFTKASMLSADGRCRAFDASGKGYVRAEGGAVLLLKPLDQAIADGDAIQAVILATGANADGARKSGLTIPSSDAQAELMKSVLARTGLSAQDIDFVEAHGTGTIVGDPVEVAAIGEVYGKGRHSPLPIGSVKANLGHLESASGMAGIVKTILALKNRALPPQIHVEEPNPNIDFSSLNLQLVTEYLEFPKDSDQPLVAGVNSFGFGGANAHVLLQEYKRGKAKATKGTTEILPPLFLSARSDAALRALAECHAALLFDKNWSDYYDIAYADAYRRDRLEKRLALVAGSPAEAAEKLAKYAQGDMPDDIVLEDALVQQGGIAFVYSGNGAQWVGMGLRLLAESSRFAELLSEINARIQPVAGFCILTELQAKEDASRLNDTVVAQPLLFSIQVAITQLLKEQGIEPSIVTGHSVGEVAAAWAAGALDLDAAIRVIVARSQAQGETRGTGRMAAVGISEAAMQSVLAEMGSQIDVAIAGINSHNNITISGSFSALQRIHSQLTAKGIFFRFLDLDYSFHSSHMEPIHERLLESLDGLQPRASHHITYVSTVTGGVLPGEQLDSLYWWKNVREPVRFSDAITNVGALGCRIFIEIGPHAILQRYISEGLAGAEIKGRVLPTLRKEADGWNQLVQAILRVHLLVEKANLGIFFPQKGLHVHLPNYPWQRDHYWHPRTCESLLAIDRRRLHPLLGWKIPENNYSWENIVDPVIFPWLADHKVGSAIVFPGAAYAEMALAAACEWRGGDRLTFEDLEIIAPMVFNGEHARVVRFNLQVRDGSFQIKSRQRLSEDEWSLHAAGRLLEVAGSLPAPRLVSMPVKAEKINKAVHYRLAAELGLDYGPAFQGLREVDVSENCLTAEIIWPTGLDKEGYLIHPALLDVCFQSLIDFFCNEIEAGQGCALLPVKIGRFDRHRATDFHSFRARLNNKNTRSVKADFELFDTDGNHVASLADCRFRVAPLMHKERGKVDQWHILPWLRPHPAEEMVTELPVASDLVAQILRVQDNQPELRQRWFKEILPLLEGLVLAFAFEAFQSLEQSGEGLLHRLITSSDSYVCWMKNLLQQEGLLREQKGNWSLITDASLPAAGDIWRTLVQDYPSCLPQLVLLGRVGRHLSQLLSQGDDRHQFLEALWLSPTAAILYEEDPAYTGIRSAIENILHYIACGLPAHRRLRVLELATGPSEVPRRLLAHLAEDRLDYVLALPDKSNAERQRSEYTQYSNLTFATLNLSEWRIAFGNESSEIFDVVIVRHVLHRALNPKLALSQSRRWLANGGRLLIAERHPDWSVDFLNGLDPAWWHVEADTSVPMSSLHAPSAWVEILDSEGFVDVLEFSEPAADGLSEGTYLLLAQHPVQDSIELSMTESARWLLLADDASSELANQLFIRLKSMNQRVETSDSLVMESLAEFNHVVHLRGWNAVLGTCTDLLNTMLAQVQSLSVCTTNPPHLWIVTRGGALASEMPPSCALNPGQSALWGFGRVVMNEHPELNCTLIELAGKQPINFLSALANELLHSDGTSEIILTDAGRYSLVMREVTECVIPTSPNEERFRLDFHLPGQLRNLVWLPQEKRSLRSGEVEVHVQATGLNFRDVMYVMGLLPEEAVENGFAGASLGLEFSGIVNHVGPGVHDLQVGDKVIGFGSACFASHVVTRADAVALMPKEWSFESAATVPTVFLTVYYALKHLADLQPGERVLIHGGAGGVGIAAIQLAKHLGAEIFATAGTDDKRDFVHLLGADHVYDSRSLAYADAILAATNGEGVDVVLNSLAGEAIRRNLRILKPFGRFLELGKRDFFENTSIGLRPFKDNISYFGIDADQLLIRRPQLAERLFKEVMELFSINALAPLPSRVFSASRVIDAFRVMQQAKHIGKLVVSLVDMRSSIERPASFFQPISLAKESTWLVAGGLSGFGLESARWLASRGVENLILIGRRGIETPGAKEAIADLSDKGVNVQALACDITSPEAVRQMVDFIQKAFPPIRGVLHAAAVFDDALLQNLDATRMNTVVAPKLLGAWNLHQATLGIPLDYFVLYSSITTAIGNPGQGNYVAANAGLEGLAAMRRHMGLPAHCIGWGPIGDAGYLTRNDAVRTSLGQRLGKPPLSANQALSLLDHILSKNSSLFVANFDWTPLARVLPSSGGYRFTILNRSLKDDDLAGNDAELQALITNKSSSEVTEIIQQLVIQEVAQILTINAERIDPLRSLHDLGLDSLMAVELAMGLEQRFGIQFPAMMLNESPTVEKITHRIVDRLLGIPEEKDPKNNAMELMVQDMAKQHGETISMEDVEQIAERAHALMQQSTRQTA